MIEIGKEEGTHSIITEIVNDIELLCININLKRQKSLCLVVYRSPDAPMKSFDEFEIALQYLDAKSINYIVIGDVNCDVTKTVPSSQTRSLLNIIADYGLKQFVSKPTRITPLSATTIEVLFSSNHEHVQYCDVAPITL